jgi:hypothetical protein
MTNAAGKLAVSYALGGRTVGFRYIDLVGGLLGGKLIEH